MQIDLGITMVDLSCKNIRIKFGWKNFWCPRSVTLRGHEKNANNLKYTQKNLKSLKHQNHSTMVVRLTKKNFSKKISCYCPFKYTLYGFKTKISHVKKSLKGG